jgi:hypothetical protein
VHQNLTQKPKSTEDADQPHSANVLPDPKPALRATKVNYRVGWKGYIRARFLRELRDCSASVGIAVRNLDFCNAGDWRSNGA